MNVHLIYFNVTLEKMFNFMLFFKINISHYLYFACISDFICSIDTVSLNNIK